MSAIYRDSGAAISPCERYRYTLYRGWEGGSGMVAFVCVNPSTANASDDDPTIRRCVDYAKRWGFQYMQMVNLFAYRATDPSELHRVVDPIGPLNDYYIEDVLNQADLVVAAWGVNGAFLYRDVVVRKMIPRLHYLKLTKDGFPSHPLYLKKDLTPQLWEST